MLSLLKKDRHRSAAIRLRSQPAAEKKILAYHAAPSCAVVNGAAPGRCAVRPPSMTSDWPVKYDELSEKSQTTLSAISSGEPIRESGCTEPSRSRASCDPKTLTSNCVLIAPGLTALTRMPNLPNSIAADRKAQNSMFGGDVRCRGGRREHTAH